MTPGEVSRRRALAWASGAVAAATTAIYVAAAAQEGDNAFWHIFPWALLMVIGTSAALWSAAVDDPGVARVMATFAAVLLMILGAVAVLSVGAGFLLAAALAALAATTRPDVRSP